MREIRADPPIGGGAVDRVAAHATGPLEEREPLRGVVASRWRRGLKLRLFPGIEFRRRLGDDEEMHPGVLGSAEFRAAAEMCPGLVGLQPDVIRMLRNRRDFSREFRHPEFVQHVGRFEPHGDRLAHWDVKFIRHHDARLRVAPLPPPLMAGHDKIWLGRGRRIGQVHRACRECKKRYHDQARNRRPHDLDRVVARELMRIRFAFAPAKAHQRVYDDSADDDENDRKDEPRHDGQIDDRTRLGRVRIQHP